MNSSPKHSVVSDPVPALRAAALAMVLGLAATAAQAIKVGGDDAEPRREATRDAAQEVTRDRSRAGASAAASPGSGATAPSAGLELARATVDAVDVAKGLLTLGGQALPLHPSGLRVISADGLRLSGANALRAGMRLRFAREPAAKPVAADDTTRRIVLIYIESQP